MRILAIGAHADDIELGCGGTLARAVKNGHIVKCLYTSQSDYTDREGYVLRDRKTVINELESSLKILGVDDYDELDYPAKDVPFNSDIISDIDRVLEEFKPDLVLTHWPFDTHQSHRNTSLSTVSSVRNLNNVLMYEPFPPSGRSYIPFRPQVYIDISDDIDKKLESIKAHKSQLDKYGDEWFESIKGRAKMRGYEARTKYAEAFELLRLRYEL
jgi:LmbE family N-acetylglucosaminyl deacetylase